jgi:AraC family transcriptional regulator
MPAASSFHRWLSAPRVHHAQVIASREDFGLPGVDFQLGMNNGCNIDQVLIKGHYIGIQLNDELLDVETRQGGDWVKVRNPSRSIWIQPDGVPFSLRHHGRSRWAGIILPTGVLNAICGQAMTLQPRYGVEDQLLCDLFSSIIHQMTDRRLSVSSSLTLSEALMRSLILALGNGHALPLPTRGGISAHQRRLLDEWLDENLEESISVDQMAALLGLSTAHFAREFKRSTGTTPWDHVTNLRVERACQLLAGGECISVVVGRCGFSDHAHLSRTLKARRGVTPSQIRQRIRHVVC